MTTAAIIQARMGSTRLPGKVLMDIGGRTMLERVVMRIRRAHLVDDVVVATTNCAADDVIADLSHALGIICFRGDERDVLDRYHQAATACSARNIVRITSDCPLIDPAVADRVIGDFLEVQPDYASNIFERTYPRGLDTEVFTADALERAWRDAKDHVSRVHVTPYIWGHPNLFKLHSVTGRDQHADLRWTVDTQLDLDVIRNIYSARGNEDFITWEEALSIVGADPVRLTRNQIIEQKKLEDG